jgi:hypothetical protein
MSFKPGTMVQLIQPELFEQHERGPYVVLEDKPVDTQNHKGINDRVCKILQSGTGKVFHWYSDLLEEI